MHHQLDNIYRLYTCFLTIKHKNQQPNPISAFIFKEGFKIFDKDYGELSNLKGHNCKSQSVVCSLLSNHIFIIKKLPRERDFAVLFHYQYDHSWLKKMSSPWTVSYSHNSHFLSSSKHLLSTPPAQRDSSSLKLIITHFLSLLLSRWKKKCFICRL